ncbi:MAG: hypothetical protein JSS10_05085 [Verrucomicrobia bacterium]|nr:hypothetical protein [Verrucomicrobiota bacterium]
MTQAQDPISRVLNAFMEQHAPRYACSIPFATQIVFKVARQKLYEKMRDHPLPNFIKNSLDLRHKIILGFQGLQAIETVIFLKLSLSNRWFLLPACYTLGHFVWTAYSYSRERQIAPNQYQTMDGLLNYNDV